MKIKVGNYELVTDGTVKTVKELTDLFLQSFPLATKEKVEKQAKELLKSKSNGNYTDATINEDSGSAKSDTELGKRSTGKK